MEAHQKYLRFVELLKSDPTNVRLRLDCIDAALQSKDFDSALNVVESGLSLTHNQDELLFAKTNALIGMQDYAAAAKILSDLHALYPGNNAITQNLALCAYCLGDFADARRNSEMVYANGDHSVGVIRLLVSSCHHLGLMDRALAVADENKELARTDSALAGVYALLYLDANRPADAARCAVYSLRQNPNGIDALTVDATLKLSTGAVDGAQKGFERILEMNHRVGRAWIGLGSISMLRKDFVRAKEQIKRGLDNMPQHVGSWHLLGWLCLVEGELQEAESSFEKAMELNRNFAESHGALAAIAAMRGNIDRAQEMIKVAFRLDPNCLSARFAQSVVVAKSGDPARAQEIIQEGLKIIGGDNEMFKRLISRSVGTK